MGKNAKSLTSVTAGTYGLQITPSNFQADLRFNVQINLDVPVLKLRSQICNRHFQLGL